MTTQFYIIVGDDYEKFAEQEHVYSVSSFYEKMLRDQRWPEKEAVVVVGQGIGYHDREFIERTLRKRSIKDIVSHPPVATVQQTHKRTQENVLISTPEKLSRYNYAFDLSITDKVDRLSDHVTGKHVGAMLLMEASRQATIAVLEDEYGGEVEAPYNLILDRFDSQFSGYLFPLPASLNTTIEELRSSSKNITVIVKSTVSQSGAVIATISLDVTLCVAKVLEKIEARKSQSSVKELRQFYIGKQVSQRNIA